MFKFIDKNLMNNVLQWKEKSSSAYLWDNLELSEIELVLLVSVQKLVQSITPVLSALVLMNQAGQQAPIAQLSGVQSVANLLFHAAMRFDQSSEHVVVLGIVLSEHGAELSRLNLKLLEKVAILGQEVDDEPLFVRVEQFGCVVFDDRFQIC